MYWIRTKRNNLINIATIERIVVERGKDVSTIYIWMQGHENSMSIYYSENEQQAQSEYDRLHKWLDVVGRPDTPNVFVVE